MKKYMVIGVFMVIIGLGVSSFALTASSLDGKTFTGHMASTSNKSQVVDDNITFQNGTFISLTCEKQGFVPGLYTSSQSGDNIMFQAMIKNNSNETMAWKGTITGESVGASIVKTLADGKTEKWEYKGIVQK